MLMTMVNYLPILSCIFLIGNTAKSVFIERNFIACFFLMCTFNPVYCNEENIADIIVNITCKNLWCSNFRYLRFIVIFN